MGMVFNKFLHFPDLQVQIFVRIHLLVSSFGISGFMAMIFGKFLRIYGYTSSISPDLWLVHFRFE